MLPSSDARPTPLRRGGDADGAAGAGAGSVGGSPAATAGNGADGSGEDGLSMAAAPALLALGFPSLFCILVFVVTAPCVPCGVRLEAGDAPAVEASQVGPGVLLLTAGVSGVLIADEGMAAHRL